MRLAGVPALVAAAALGCSFIPEHAAILAWYEHAELPASRSLLDLPYHLGPEADPQKHRLDLYLPPSSAAPGWPVLVFVHGGGWTRGDRAYEVAGEQVFRNVGRFYAARGIGSAVISYRLQPHVGWREQVTDVARAVSWLYERVSRYGGDRHAFFLMGHSAGAHLAAHVTYDRRVLSGLGVPPDCICGLVSISGSAFDLTDEALFALPTATDYFAERLQRDVEPDWRIAASPIRFIDRHAPPTLVMYAESEIPGLRSQARLLHAAVREVGVWSDLLEIEGENHLTIVLALSHPEHASSEGIEAFVRDTVCPPP